MPVPVWGWSEPGAKVMVGFAGQKESSTADNSGRWLIKLQPMRASAESRELTVTSVDKKVTLKDVLVGEVWLASGQSNMGLAISKAKGGREAVANADLPRLRMFRVKQNPMYEPGADVDGDWFACSPNAFKEGRDFSAVAFFFGQELLNSQDCPIGLIGSYVGGSPVEAWMSTEALTAFPVRRGVRTETWKRLYAFRQARDGMAKAMADHGPKLAAWEAELAARNQAHRNALTAWKEAAAKAREAKQEPPPRPQPAPVSRRPLEPNRYPHHATVLFRGMIEPLIPYGMRGAIWYQGEANCYPRRAEEYATSFPLMIADWRERWGQGDFPFLFVQLPNFAKAKNDWMTLRESQRLVAGSVPNAAMVVTIDVGDPNDLHAADKKPVADRLALLARVEVYGEDAIASGPMIESAKRMDDGRTRLTFRHPQPGLQSGATGGAKLGGFELAGEDGVFVPAQAGIQGGSVVVWRDDVETHHVRYAWAPNPFPAASLYNRRGLPASPFIIKVE
ncbi:MAG: sialate O-acetylesterase [Fuerstiella sp.]|nr:sialate O-acetylesterase [Fuerstiella sp.]